MTNLFSMDWKKDSKLIGKSYTLVNLDDDINGLPTGKDIKAKFVEIDKEGYYAFQVTTKTSCIEGFKTKAPNDGDIK